MKIRALTLAVLTAGAVGVSAPPAVAHQTIYANPPRLSGTIDTGRIVATGAYLGGQPWGGYTKTQCMLQKRIGNRWVDYTFGRTGHRSNSWSNKCVWTTAAEKGRFRLRVRVIRISRTTGGVTFGKWNQSNAVTFTGYTW